MPESFQKFSLIVSLVIIWSLVALIFTAISYLGGKGAEQNARFWSLLVENCYRYGLWGLFSPLIFLLAQKFDFQSKRYYLRNLSVQILLALLFSSAHFVGYILLLRLTDTEFREQSKDLLLFLKKNFISYQYLGLLIYALIVFASQAYLRNKKFAEEEKKASVLQSQLVQAQLQALKMQLQPHFLFNTLNSISSLVIKNPVQAQTMIARLGEFLRMTLDFNKNQMVLLSEEVNFLRSYLEIERIRFSEKLQIVFSVDEEVMSAVVPHLALQPVVENSVKHGISRMTMDGRIEIIGRMIENKLFLRVKDNGPGEANSQSTENSKTGLSNLRARLEHLYGDDFSFEIKPGSDGGTVVTILIPANFDFAAAEADD